MTVNGSPCDGQTVTDAGESDSSWVGDSCCAAIVALDTKRRAAGAARLVVARKWLREAEASGGVWHTVAWKVEMDKMERMRWRWDGGSVARRA